MRHSRRKHSRARQLGRTMLAAYLLLLFTPVSVAADLSLCVCDQCSRLESCPLISCSCQAVTADASGRARSCGCCSDRALTARAGGAGDECPAYRVPVSPAAKLKLPRPQWDNAHLVLTVNTADLLPAIRTTPVLRLAAPARGPAGVELRTVQLLM